MNNILKTLCILIIPMTYLVGCAGGAEKAAAMPTPILCKTILDLTPAYVRYDEYLAELKKRGEDCHQYLGDTNNIRIR